MRAVASAEMIRDAVGDDVDSMMIPPQVEVSDDHPLWPLVEAALRDVYDPEIPVNIYELGLIYKVDISKKDNTVYIEMSLTSPACPVAGEMPGMIQDSVRTVDSIGEVTVEIIWDPVWDPSRMAETAKLQLNMY